MLIEVLSPGTAEKDTFTKLNLYKDSGIKEYWIIDPSMGNTIIYRFEDSAIAETRFYSSGQLCESMIYPGLTFGVSE
jgi:Uma2 family endonuclease